MSSFQLAGRSIEPGERVTLDLPVIELYTHSPLHMPVQVVRGKKPGPTLFVSAAIHGDEINGVEIVRRLLAHGALKKLRGTLIAIPVVNVQGFLAHSRYTPDRRDLNRSFPGSERGSVAGRLANLFVKEILEQADCGIDLHTAAIHRDNLPQIRADLDDARNRELAEAFGVAVILNAELRPGSLRGCAGERGIPMLLYEAGEALRFDETCIRAGLRGVLNVMRKLDMLPSVKTAIAKPVQADTSYWVRADKSGVMCSRTALGTRVAANAHLADIADPLGEKTVPVTGRHAGIVIGRTNLPLVNEGDALYHIARFGDSRHVGKQLRRFHDDLGDDPALDAMPEIV